MDNIKQNRRTEFKNEYLFDDLFKCRFVAEKTNIWLEAIKAIQIHFETNLIY
jgi:hypothetical protein